MMYGYIYLIINLINNMKYIGQRKFGLREPYLGSGLYLKRAIKKYGPENFTKEILYECKTREELNQKEIEIIAEWDAVNSPDYYNITKGGEGFNGKHSDETKKKMSETTKGIKREPLSEERKRKISESLKGRVISKEWCAKLSKSCKGRKFTEETKRKMSLSHKGKKMKPLTEEHKKKLSLSNMGKPGPNLGKHFSEETKKKMSLARLGKNNTFYGKHHSDETKKKISETKMRNKTLMEE